MEGKIITIPGSRVYTTKEVRKGQHKIESNSYLIKTPKMNILIDAGSIRIFDVLSEQEIKQIDKVLFTHAHTDHFNQLTALQDQFNFEIYLHIFDYPLLMDSKLNDSHSVGLDGFTAKVEHINSISDNQTLRFDNFDFQVIHTPGHTPGSVMYYYKDLNALFTGDMILGKITGSATFNAGNENAKKSSIKKIKAFLDSLPEDTNIYPGHGPVINLQKLKEINHEIWPKSKNN